MAKPRMLHCTHWGMVCPAETPGMYTAPQTHTHSMIVIVVIVVCFLFTCFYWSERDVSDVSKAISFPSSLSLHSPLFFPSSLLSSLLSTTPPISITIADIPFYLYHSFFSSLYLHFLLSYLPPYFSHILHLLFFLFHLPPQRVML